LTDAILAPRRGSTALLSLLALIAFAILVSLGLWQVERLHWKEALIARIEALLRRTRLVAASEPRGEAVVVEGLRIDPDLRRAFVRTADGQAESDWEDAQLTPTEFRLVVALARQEGKALSRDELQRRVWGIPYRHRDRTVDVCVRKIREKLDRRSPSHDYVHTHYGVGYRFAAEAR